MKFAMNVRYAFLFAQCAIVVSTLPEQVFAKQPNNKNNNRGEKFLSLSMEDDFKELSTELITTLSKSGANKEFLDDGCKKYVGKNIPASIGKENTVWLVTTPGCGWGAHSAPIWMLETSQKGSRLIFSGGGIGFDLLAKSQNGYRDIVVSNSSAGYYGDVHYKFNGKTYIKFASRFAELSDPNACKKLPDIVKCK